MGNDLRKSLIRLAHEKPELRKDLLPLLSKEAATWTREIYAPLKKALQTGFDMRLANPLGLPAKEFRKSMKKHWEQVAKNANYLAGLSSRAETVNWDDFLVVLADISKDLGAAAESTGWVGSIPT